VEPEEPEETEETMVEDMKRTVKVVWEELQKTANRLEEMEKVVQPIVEKVTEEARETEVQLTKEEKIEDLKKLLEQTRAALESFGIYSGVPNLIPSSPTFPL
jgi:mevalonate kinase